MSNDKVKSAIAVTGAFVLVLAAANPSDSASAAATPDPAATTNPPTPTPTPTKKSTRKPVVTATKPPRSQLPPPPVKVPDSPDCTQHPGPDAPFSEVSDALTVAAAKQYWVGVVPPAGLVGPLPKLTVPTSLMKAVAWTESSWRSTIISCDKGIGVMQVMEPTRDSINNRFGSNYDINTLAGNAALGATYLEWSMMYFGLYYFGTFDLNAVLPVGDNGAMLKLQDVVIASYNYGMGGVENLHGTQDGSDDTLFIPNQWYVDRVDGYIADCPCPA